MIRFFSTGMLMLLISSSVWAQHTRMHAGEDYADETWGITFGAAYTTRVLVHNETSANTSYATSGRRVRVPDVKMSLSFMKELLNPNTFSVTLLASGGIADSSGKSSEENLPEFEEKLNGFHYGGGLSFNYNTYAYGLKLQYYLSGQIMVEEGELNIEHKNGATNLNTIHEFDAQIGHVGLGIRAFDADHSLMSYFELSAPFVMSEEFTPSGQVGNSIIDITSETSITRDPVAFSMGFGYYF